MSLALPVFVLLFFGIIDGARLVFTYNAVGQAAREGARLAAVQAAYIGKSGATCTEPVCPATTGALHANVLAASNGELFMGGPLATGQLQITCTAFGSAPTGSWTGDDCASGNVSGNVVSVRVSLPFTPLIPFTSVSLGSSATMAIP